MAITSAITQRASTITRLQRKTKCSASLLLPCLHLFRPVKHRISWFADEGRCLEAEDSASRRNELPWTCLIPTMLPSSTDLISCTNEDA